MSGCVEYSSGTSPLSYDSNELSLLGTITPTFDDADENVMSCCEELRVNVAIKDSIPYRYFVPLAGPSPGLLLVRKAVQALEEFTTRSSSSSSNVSPAALALALGTFLRDVQHQPPTPSFSSVCLYMNPSTGSLLTLPLEGILVLTEAYVGKKAPPPIVVDCAFRDKFVVARPTSRFDHYLHHYTPKIFVGYLEDLERCVDMVVSEQQRSLLESGLEVPPWRTAGGLKATLRQHCTVTLPSSDEGAYLMSCVGRERQTRTRVVVCGSSEERTVVPEAIRAYRLLKRSPGLAFTSASKDDASDFLGKCGV